MTTPAERKVMLKEELRRAVSEAADVAYPFVGLCEALSPSLEALEEAAREVSLKAARVAGFAHLLSREDRS